MIGSGSGRIAIIGQSLRPEVRDPAVSGILIPQEQQERCPGTLPLPDCTARPGMPYRAGVTVSAPRCGAGRRRQVLASPITRLDHGGCPLSGCEG